MPLLALRLRLALVTLPTPGGWAVTLALLLAASALAAGYGRRTGFLALTAPPAPRTVGQILLVAWLSPALIEEALFRALLLPHPTENVPLPALGLWSVLALMIFVGAHPIRTLVRPLPRNRVFTDRRFLILAALLGLTCTSAYLATGSVWSPTAIHYLLVAVWLMGLGGGRKVGVS